jgi:hypothetical protein
MALFDGSIQSARMACRASHDGAAHAIDDRAVEADSMKLRDRITQLESENMALRQKLTVRVELDRSFQSYLHEAVNAVARNVSQLDNEKRERVLLAVAVLYGIIQPTTRKKTPAAAMVKT